MVEDEQRRKDLDDLNARLQAARKVAGKGREEDDQRSPRNMSGMGLGFRIAIELISTVLVGVALGWALDQWLGTRPIFMVVFLFLGGAAGVMNVYRVVKGLDDSVGLGQAIERKKRLDKEQGGDNPPPH